MKPTNIDICICSPIGLDRLATWNEVRCAMDSDFSNCVCNLPEDVMSLAIVGEMSDAGINQLTGFEGGMALANRQEQTTENSQWPGVIARASDECPSAPLGSKFEAR